MTKGVKRKMKLRKMWVLATALCCLACCSAEEEVDTYVASLTVQTTSPTVEHFQTQASTVASLEPGTRVVLLPTVSGEILQMNATLGGTVNVGDLIAVIDNENAQTQVENREDQVDAVQTQIRNAESRVETAQNSVTRAEEAIETILEGMLVKAPVSGYVQSIDEKYMHSVSSSTQLAYLSNQKQMTVKIPFLDSYVNNSWIGQTAQLSFVETGESMTGRVTEISGATAYLYGNVAVNYITITVDNPGGIPVGRKVAASVNGISCSDNGEFESQASSPVICGLNGTLDEIYVSVGQYVTAGTTMFRITSTSVESQLKSAQDNLDDAKKALEDAYDDLQDIYDDLADAYEDLADAKADLEDYRVRANVSGTISAVLAQKFDMASPSSGLIEVSTTNHMEVTFSVSEAVLPYLSLGQELAISSQGQNVTGRISEIAKVANSQTGLFTIIGTITGESVLTGTSAQVEYTDFEVKNALVIPFSAVHFVGDECYVFVVEQGEAVKKEIQVAQFTAEKIIVTDGLTTQDTLISSWSTQLRNGLPVVIAGEISVQATEIAPVQDDVSEADNQEETEDDTAEEEE